MTDHQDPTERSPLLAEQIKPVVEDDVGEAGSSGRGEGSHAETVEYSTRYLIAVLSSVWFGCFLAALDSTIIATLSAPISSSFESLSLLSWLASAYFIANAAFQPLSGRLTDLTSRKFGLIISNIFFAAGNLICGLAGSAKVMVLGRVVAGIGGGGLPAIASFVASDMIPPRRRGVWQGLSNIFYALGAGVGGVLGGWINDTWGWRAAFLVQVPLTVVSGILVVIFVKKPAKKNPTAKNNKKIDYLGAITLTFCIVLLLAGLNTGGNQLPWLHPLIVTSLALAVVAFGAFVYIESHLAASPVIPVKLLLDRTTMSACLTNWFTSMAVFALLFYAPLFFQTQGSSATSAGVRLIPQSIGAAVGSLSSGIIMKRTGKHYWLSLGNMLVLVVCAAGFCFLKLNTTSWPIMIDFFFLGISYGVMLTVTLAVLVAAVPFTEQAAITSASYAFRSTGSTIGITIASVTFQNTLKAALWNNFGSRPDAADVIGEIRDRGVEYLDHLPSHWRIGVLDAYNDAFVAVFAVVAGLSVLAAVVNAFSREVELGEEIAIGGE
ncbi:MFS general substrate transporter [Polychaeton citri CBS 116435]|uniref:MFS general substrate transporter n=1 Tax=Polychaeton citri CBS 116435 TaxID=1314669 RepID=A0A9P4USM1_9PEZI|nr:MFS general substrate transporter [Polychaeton citri CBS 116435]